MQRYSRNKPPQRCRYRRTAQCDARRGAADGVGVRDKTALVAVPSGAALQRRRMADSAKGYDANTGTTNAGKGTKNHSKGTTNAGKGTKNHSKGTNNR